MKLFDSICPWLREDLEMLETSVDAGRLGHGWLVSGPAGTGKRNLVYLLAARLLEPQVRQASLPDTSPERLLAGYAALDSAEDLHPDLHRIRLPEDKHSISIEQIRDMTAALGLTPHLSERKVVVIEQADTMTTAAANALLKSLEEPTRNTFLFLIADQPGKLPATIRSRCQRLAIPIPSAAATNAWLRAETSGNGEIPPEFIAAGPLIAARAMLDNDFINEYKDISNTINLIYEGDADPLAVAETWQKQGIEQALGYLIDSLRQRIRGLLVPDRWTPITDSDRPFIDNSRTQSKTDQLFRGLEIAENLREQIGRGVNVELALKALLLELAQT